MSLGRKVSAKHFDAARVPGAETRGTKAVSVFPFGPQIYASLSLDFALFKTSVLPFMNRGNFQKKLSLADRDETSENRINYNDKLITEGLQKTNEEVNKVLKF